MIEGLRGYWPAAQALTVVLFYVFYTTLSVCKEVYLKPLVLSESGCCDICVCKGFIFFLSLLSKIFLIACSAKLSEWRGYIL